MGITGFRWRGGIGSGPRVRSRPCRVLGLRRPQQGLDPVDVRGNVDADALVVDRDHGNGNPIFKGAELFEAFGGFQVGDGEAHQTEEGFAAKAVNPEVLAKREARQLHLRRGGGVIPEVGDRAAREVERASIAGDDDLHDVGIVQFGRVAQGGGGGGHLGLGKRGSHRVNDGGIDQRFVALDVENGVAVESFGDFRDAIRATGMVRTGHLDADKLPGDPGDPFVVGCHDDLGQGAGKPAALDHALDQGLTGDGMEGFAGETRGRVSGRNQTHDAPWGGCC